MSRLLRVLSVVGPLLLLLCEVDCCRADEHLEPFVEGLRQRRLFGLADEYCRRQLADPKLEESLRGRVTVELLRVMAEQAAQSPPVKRRELIAGARKLSADFAREQADHPRALLVRAQESLALLAVGESVRRETELAEATADEPATYDEARGLLRDGLRLVDALDRELTQLIPQRFRRPLAAPALSAEELTTLQANLRFQRVRAQRQLALCYAPDSTDRVGGLAAALQAVEKTLTPLPHDDPLAPRLQLERAILLRLTERRSEAATALGEDAWQETPVSLRLSARAERLRLRLDAGQHAEALREAEVTDGEAESPSAELDFARLELYLALWGRAEAAKSPNATDESARWERLAIGTLEQIDARHGMAWRRRGDLLLVRMATSGNGPRSLAALRRTADSFYLQGRFDDAIAALGQAAAQAESAGDADERFALLYKAALIEQKRGRHGAAADRLSALATSLPKHSQAAAAQHLASWNLAQTLTALPADDLVRGLARYQEFLERQIETWPDDPATQESRLWLGKLRESQRAWDRAAEAFRGVSPLSPHYAAALEGAGRAWLARLDQLRENPAARRTEAEAAGRFFEQAAYGTSPEALDRWTDPQRAAALVAARAWFETGATQHARTERLLRAALEHSPDATESWRATAQSLLLVALAGQESRRDEALELVARIGQLAPAAVAESAERVATLRVTSRGDGRERLAQLELALIEALSKRLGELPESTRDRLTLNQAAALAAAGRRDDALAAYRALVKARPRSAAVQEALAELLLGGSSAVEWREALDHWRRLAANSPPRSTRWYRAKFGVASAEHRLGNHQSAAQLIRFLQVTPPGLADTPLEPQFLELLRRCESALKNE